MNAFEKILSEIDNGIKTIKPLMKGETRQIAESQIIGLEEARKIVEKYKGDTGWIPCSERLPEYDVPVIAQWKKYYSDENYLSILSLNESGEWYGELGMPNGKVVAWMPLPQPYREEDSNE